MDSTNRNLEFQIDGRDETAHGTPNGTSVDPSTGAKTMTSTPFSIQSLFGNAAHTVMQWGDWGLIIALFLLIFGLFLIFAFTCWIGGGVRDMIERRRDYIARYRLR